MSLHPGEVLIAPVVSEKSYGQIAQNRYTFKVHQDAHKTQVRQAVEELFEVKVERVNVLKVQPKPKRRGNTKGTKAGWKKAVVQLRKGDTIAVPPGTPHAFRVVGDEVLRLLGTHVSPKRIVNYQDGVTSDARGYRSEAT